MNDRWDKSRGPQVTVCPWLPAHAGVRSIKGARRMRPDKRVERMRHAAENGTGRRYDLTPPGLQ